VERGDIISEIVSKMCPCHGNHSWYRNWYQWEIKSICLLSRI